MNHPLRDNPAVSGRVVVVGASTGGVSALRSLASQLPPDLPAAVVVVLHIGAHPSLLPALLSAAGPMPAAHAEDGEHLRPGRIYVAPPDQHLLVQEGRLHLTRGPKEHHSRPAVDPLFRSAALAHGPGVVGVVLTGHLDDGTAGLQAIKACGGIAIVQDPGEAQEPSMPLSAMHHVDVDYCLPVDAIARTLVKLAREAVPPAPAEPAATAALSREHGLSLTTPSGDVMEHLKAFAEPSTLVCPDCGGSLWEVKDARPTRFRCHTGHAFTMRTLAHTMNEATDRALQTAMRALQEQAILLRKGAATSRKAGAIDEARAIEAGADKAQSQADALRAMAEQPVIQPLEPPLAREN